MLHRFGAIGQHGSIAIIERFWRTLKDMLDVRFRPPLSARDLHERAHVTLLHYAALRPHQALSGATPAELYFGLEPLCSRATRPPLVTARGAPAVAEALPLRVEFLDRERRLPILLDNELAA